MIEIASPYLHLWKLAAFLIRYFQLGFWGYIDNTIYYDSSIWKHNEMYCNMIQFEIMLNIIKPNYKILYLQSNKKHFIACGIYKSLRKYWMGRGAESKSLVRQIPMPHVSHGMADEPVALKFRHAALHHSLYSFN